MKSTSVAVAMMLAALCTPSLLAQDDLGRRALDHSDYEKWNSLSRAASISEEAACTRPRVSGLR